MKTAPRLLRWVTMGFAAVVAMGPTLPPAAAAAPRTIGIRLVDAPTSRADDPRARLYVVDHLAPGTTIERRVEVSNDTDARQTIQVYAAAASVNEQGFAFGEDRAANELTGWTTVTPPTLSLLPGGKGLATVTIAVPASASAGERYGVVWAEVSAPPAAGGGLTTVNRVGVRIYLSVGPGGEPPTDFEIVSLKPQRDPDGSPVVAATVRNTGGRALDLSGELKLANGPGALSAGPFPAQLGTTLGVNQTAPVLVTLDRAVPAGPWDATLVLRSGTVERDAEARLTFPAARGTPSNVPDPDTTPAGAVSRRGTSPLIPALVILSVAGLVVALVARRRHARRDPHAQDG